MCAVPVIFCTDGFSPLWFLLLLPIAYAEIHYTLKGFSLVSRKRPEIIADAPWRVEPGESIPLLILVKDAHRFPVRLNSICVETMDEQGSARNTELLEKDIEIHSPWWYRIFEIIPEKRDSGQIQLNVKFRTTCVKTGRIRHFENDNLWSSSHAPLHVTQARDPLTSFNDWIQGDLHFHSSNTNDQVEYGPPLEVTVRMARALGLRFMAVTDHSYDLDDEEDNYLKNDPELGKWQAMLLKTEQLENRTGLILLPGEEVSCGNHLGQNVHLLLLNNRDYFPGAGDSNERWFKNRPDMSIYEIINQMDEDTLAFAAHPGFPFAPLQWILLRRGVWSRKDMNHPGLHGLQIYNGSTDRAFKRSRRLWIKQLLKGKKPIIIAGNDAHGNFNRSRKLGQPFLYVSESKNHTFGRGRTLLHVPDGISRIKIMDALKKGRACITTGPVMKMRITNEQGNTASIGDSISGQIFSLDIEGLSTREFGGLTRCDIFTGRYGENRETLFKRIHLKNKPLELKDKFMLNEKIDYIRGELFSRSPSSRHFCMTNPIWISR